MRHPPGIRLLLRMPGTDQRQRQRRAEDLLCLYRHCQVPRAGTELRASGRCRTCWKWISFPETSQGDPSAPRQSQRHSRGLAVTTEQMAVRGSLGLVPEGFWEGASDPNLEATTESCHARAARPYVPSEPAAQPLERATGSLMRVSSSAPSVLWPSPIHHTYPAWPASAQAGPVFSRNRTRTSRPGWAGHSLLLSRSAAGFSISHAGVPGNRAEKAVFNLWFYVVGRKNHSGHLLPLVISSRCLF